MSAGSFQLTLYSERLPVWSHCAAESSQQESWYLALRPTPPLHLVRLVTILRFFFFSSRRRHTRSLRDWSSDVCSSDLLQPVADRTDVHPQLIGELVLVAGPQHRVDQARERDEPARGPLADDPLLLVGRSEEHTSELQSRRDLVCRLLLEKKKKTKHTTS